MAEIWAAIQAAVGKSLTTKVPGQAEAGRYAQDRALRAVRCIDRLAPLAGERMERVDLARVAALYTGVAQNIAGAGAGKAADEEAFDGAAELAADQLKDILTAADLDLMLLILKGHRKRDAKMPEAKVLSDALSMEEFGLVGFWNNCRQFHASGKTPEQLIKLWKAQHDYGYWESRLREGFYYEASRAAARERLGQMKGIYERLLRENLCEDVGGGGGHF